MVGALLVSVSDSRWAIRTCFKSVSLFGGLAERLLGYHKLFSLLRPRSGIDGLSVHQTTPRSFRFRTNGAAGAPTEEGREQSRRLPSDSPTLALELTRAGQSHSFYPKVAQEKGHSERKSSFDLFWRWGRLSSVPHKRQYPRLAAEVCHWPRCNQWVLSIIWCRALSYRRGRRLRHRV